MPVEILEKYAALSGKSVKWLNDEIDRALKEHGTLSSGKKDQLLCELAHDLAENLIANIPEPKKANHSDAKRRLYHCQLEIAKLKEELARAQASSTEASTVEAENLRQQLAKVNKKLTKTQAEYRALQATFEECRDDRDNSRKTRDEGRQAAREARREHERQLQTCQTEITTLHNRLQAMSHDHKAYLKLQRYYDKLKAQFDECQRRPAQTSVGTETKDLYVSDRVTSNGKMKRALDQMTARLDELTRESADCTSRLAEAQAEIATLREKLAQVPAQTSLESRLKDAESALRQCQETVKKVPEKASISTETSLPSTTDVSTQVNRLEDLISQLQQELEQAQAETGKVRLEAELEQQSLRDELATVKAELASLETRYITPERCDEKLTELRSQLDKASGETADQLRREVIEAQRLYQEAEAFAQQQVTALSKMAEDSANVQKELSHQLDELQSLLEDAESGRNVSSQALADANQRAQELEARLENMRLAQEAAETATNNIQLQRIQELTEQAAQSAADRDACRQELEKMIALRETYNTCTERLQTLEKELEETKRVLEEYSAWRQEPRKYGYIPEDDHQAVIKQEADAMARVAALEAQVEALEAALNQPNLALDATQQEQIRLTADLAACQKEREEIRSQIDALQQEMDNARTSLTELQNELTTAKFTVAEYNDYKTRTSTELEEANRARDICQTSLVEVNARLQDLQTEFIALQTELANATSAIKDAKSAVDMMADERSKAVAETAASSAASSAEIADLRRQLEENMKETVTLQDFRQQLLDAQKLSLAETTRLSAELAKCLEATTAANTESAQKDVVIATKNQKIEDLEKYQAILQAQISDLERKLATVTLTETERTGALDALRNQMEAAAEECRQKQEACETRLGELSAQNADLTQRLTEANSSGEVVVTNLRELEELIRREFDTLNKAYLADRSAADNLADFFHDYEQAQQRMTELEAALQAAIEGREAEPQGPEECLEDEKRLLQYQMWLQDLRTVVNKMNIFFAKLKKTDGYRKLRAMSILDRDTGKPCYGPKDIYDPFDKSNTLNTNDNPSCLNWHYYEVMLWRLGEIIPSIIEILSSSPDTPNRCQNVRNKIAAIQREYGKDLAAYNRIVNSIEDLTGNVRVLVRLNTKTGRPPALPVVIKNQRYIAFNPKATDRLASLCLPKTMMRGSTTVQTNDGDSVVDTPMFGPFYGVYNFVSNACLYCGTRDVCVDNSTASVGTSTNPELDCTTVANKVVFDESSPGLADLMHQLNSGYTITVFMYGYSGTGKTFTTIGNETKNIPGLLQYTLGNLDFGRVSAIRLTGIKELYGEINVPVNKDTENGYIKKNSFFKVPSSDTDISQQYEELRHAYETLYTTGSSKEQMFVNLYHVINKINSLRLNPNVKHILATFNNTESSRGHLIYTITVDFNDGVSGQLNLVDMAGIESPVDLRKLYLVKMDSLSEIGYYGPEMSSYIKTTCIDRHDYEVYSAIRQNVYNYEFTESAKTSAFTIFKLLTQEILAYLDDGSDQNFKARLTSARSSLDKKSTKTPTDTADIKVMTKIIADQKLSSFTNNQYTKMRTFADGLDVKNKKIKYKWAERDFKPSANSMDQYIIPEIQRRLELLFLYDVMSKDIDEDIRRQPEYLADRAQVAYEPEEARIILDASTNPSTIESIILQSYYINESLNQLLYYLRLQSGVLSKAGKNSFYSKSPYSKMGLFYDPQTVLDNLSAGKLHADNVGMLSFLDELQHQGEVTGRPSKFVMMILINPDNDNRYCEATQLSLEFAQRVASTTEVVETGELSNSA